MIWFLWCGVIIACLFLYFAIGFSISLASWHIAKNFDEIREEFPLVCFLLFPVSAYKKEFLLSYSSNALTEVNRTAIWRQCGSEGCWYIDLIVIYLWPIKLAWNLILLPAIPCFIVLRFVFVKILWRIAKAFFEAGSLLVQLAKDKEMRELARMRRDLNKLPAKERLAILQKNHARLEEERMRLVKEANKAAKECNVQLPAFRAPAEEESETEPTDPATADTVIPIRRTG